VFIRACGVFGFILALSLACVYGGEEAKEGSGAPKDKPARDANKRPVLRESPTLKRKAEARRQWVERTVDQMQAACRKAKTVTLDIKGSYQYADPDAEPLLYSLYLVFQAPNKIHADLTELLGDKRVRREIVSDGKTTWYYREATNELSFAPASGDRQEFLAQVQGMLPGDIGFVLRGLRGDWHWFRGMRFEPNGKEEVDGATYTKLRAILSPSESEIEDEKPLERYEFSLDEKTGLPKSMVVGYTYSTQTLKLKGDFDILFDFAADPSDSLFQKPPPEGAKFVN
jgi:outer membrane lipoprotein-sorting protein